MSPVKKYDVRLCRIERAEQIAPGIYDVTVEAGELAKAARPGQFAHIYVPGKTLRRPISICETGSGTLRPQAGRANPGISLRRSATALRWATPDGTSVLSAAGSVCRRCWRPPSPLGSGQSW